MVIIINWRSDVSLLFFALEFFFKAVAKCLFGLDPCIGEMRSQTIYDSNVLRFTIWDSQWG